MSKSAGNVVAPDEVIQKVGAEILRLWVAAEDYRDDIKISPEILDRLTEAYRRIRNTWRYLVGNLYDFDPQRDALPIKELQEIDRWILSRFAQLVAQVRKAYDEYEFHLIYHAVHNFCVIELSSLYLDILKDRLYTSAPSAVRAQVCPECHLPRSQGDGADHGPDPLLYRPMRCGAISPKARLTNESVHLASFPLLDEGFFDEALEAAVGGWCGRCASR